MSGVYGYFGDHDSRPHRPTGADLDTRRLLHLLAEHCGVDLNVLEVVADPMFQRGVVFDYDAHQLADDLDEIRDAIAAGRQLPPPVTVREKTVRQIVLREREEAPR